MRIVAAALLSVSLTTTITFTAFAQSDSTDEKDLMSMLDEQNPKKSSLPVSATFKATRIVNAHSIENTAKGVLDFRILHRFGELKDAPNFFGLDGANTALELDYGVTNWLAVGISRSTYQKEYEGFAKARILRQTEDDHMPLSLSYVGTMSVQTMPAPTLPAGEEFFLSNRLYYSNQLLIARKFSKKFSLQLMPTIVHYNLVPTTDEPNNTLVAGIGGRIKLSNRISLTGEYFYRLESSELKGYHNALSFGIDIETGGHVFQLVFTNATAMSQRAVIGQTISDWGNGGVHFGFNISRVFTIVKPKGFEGSRNNIY
jgi:hypothetical protein